MTDLNPKQVEFIQSVLRLQPRIAAFDCDGTIWPGDAGEGFFSWEMEQGLISGDARRWALARHADYKAGKVPEEIMCGEMATLHHGLREEVVQKAADEWFATAIAPDIFPEMRELVQRLRSAGTDVWVVSSSSHWLIRSGMRYLGIPQDRILAAEALVIDGVVQDKLIRVPSGPGKPEALREVLASPPDCAFGNSIFDREMLAMSRHPFAINPNSSLQGIALASRWRIYQPDTNHRRRP